MATGRERKSSSRYERIRKRRRANRQFDSGRKLQMEPLEERQLLAVGPQLIGVQTNDGDLLKDGAIYNVSPRELTFQFSEGQVIDAATLEAIRVTRSGLDGRFESAAARTDFNTAGAVVVEFQAVQTGPAGEDVSLSFTRLALGSGRGPQVTVDGKSVQVALNTTVGSQTTALQLINTLGADAVASKLVRGVVISGPTTTNIATQTVNYSPVGLHPATAASVSTDFGTGTALSVVFTATQQGLGSQGQEIQVTKSNFGGAAQPIVDVLADGTIFIQLNTSPGAETTAIELVNAFNRNPDATAIATARLAVGNPNTNIASPAVSYSPLVMQGVKDVAIAPGYVGLGDSDREVIFRFSERLPDDVYRIDVLGAGAIPLRNDQGIPLGDKTDDQIDGGVDYSVQFELDLGAQILGVVPQPVYRSSSGTLSQSLSQIEVYFNSDDLDPRSVTVPDYYQLIYTNDTVSAADDVVYKPIAVQYFKESDRAMLTFAAPLHQLGSGSGTFRLRIGTDEQVANRDNTLAPVATDLTGQEVGSSYGTAHALGELTGSRIVSSSIDPQVFELAFPGSSDEPGHRDIRPEVEEHLRSMADPVNGVSTLYYNFRSDYGVDPEGTPLTNLITDQQKQRAREVFEIYGEKLGIQFVETASQGFTIATGDLRTIVPDAPTGQGDNVLSVFETSPLENELRLVLDNAENWYDGLGQPNTALQQSWFEAALRGVGGLLGVGETFDLPPGTYMGSDAQLGFGMTAEPVYPGDQDIVHGRHLYRAEGKDIDLYRFTVSDTGLLTAETIAERQADASLLDSSLMLYREVGGQRELVARNDDYFSDDSFIEYAVEPGVYYIGVSAAGNESYDPAVENSGVGGLTEGKYDLRLTFRADADKSIMDVDNLSNSSAGALSQSTPLDGDGDGVPGGVFNFWFRVDSTPIFVDKAAAPGGTGSLNSPYREIDLALAKAQFGDVVRIVGNGGVDGNLWTPEDNYAYEIGFGSTNQTLEDGNTLAVPQGVTVMVDRGAVLKLRRARIGVGSSSSVVDRSRGAFQVLGTPRMTDLGGQVVLDEFGQEIPGSVFFTSYNDETLGGDSNVQVPTVPASGDWGGIAFRGDLDEAAGRFDYEQQGIFLNYVNNADIRYGGGTVVVNGLPVAYAPVHAVDARPTITNNSITDSAQAAMSANPDAFEETNFHAPQYQGTPFTSDYTRIGPEIHGNRLVDNSINGLFVRMTTPAGQTLEKMTVTGRWDDSDVVHVLAENLRIQGSPGGPLQTLVAPDVSLVRLTGQVGGALEDGIYDYRVTFIDANGNESPPSDHTVSIEIATDPEDANASRSVLLNNLPLPTAGYDGRRIYRSIKGEFVQIAELPATGRTYLDQGLPGAGLLQGSSWQLNSRLHGQLSVSPGTIVKLNGAGIETSFGSQLLAEGVEGREVVFTSLLDDRYGAGGSFETSQETGLAEGNWTGIYAGHMSSVSIDHAVLAYGGGVAEVPGSFAGFNVLEVHQADVRLTNSVLERNANGFGGQALANREGRMSNGEGVIFVRGAQPVIVNNVARDNDGPVISIDVNSLNSDLVADLGRSTGPLDALDQLLDNQGPLIRWNRLADNGVNGMQVRGGTLTTGGVWDDTDIAHVLLDQTISVPDFHTSGGLRLESSGSESLVVKLEGPNAGFTATGRPLDITDRVGGMLHLVGQPGFPVVLTSLKDDSVGAGFQPDGMPQMDTNGDGIYVAAESTFIDPLPTLPHVDNGTLIDNNVPVVTPGHFEVAPGAGGSIPAAADGVTAAGATQVLQNETFIGAFTNYVDVGSDGGALDLAASTVTTAPQSLNPDEVTSAGTFPGNNNQAVNWASRTYFTNGMSTMYTVLTLSSNQAFGNIRFINYLDTSVLTADDDLMLLMGNPGDPDFRVAVLDNEERVGLAHGGVYSATGATWDGWAADLATDLQADISGPGTVYFVPGNIDPTALTPITDLTLGPVFGLEDAATAFAWTLDPTATSATITLYVDLLYEEPSDVGATQAEPGDWRSVILDQYAHDRNVDIAVESESGQAMISGTNETPDDSQYLGTLAPHEKAGDDNQRLGFEVHGSLNRPGDVDVYSFDADAGTEVWLDIDKTSYALDTVVELVDANGQMIARSDNSLDESRGVSALAFDPVMPEDAVNPLGTSTADVGDLWSTNPRDAGMRVVLPGPANTTNTYHVRVRSASSNLNVVQGGASRGVYQLQIRLRETDELPGSTIQNASVRYATNGIEVSGGPLHSPLTGEATESESSIRPTLTNNNTRLTADDLGNLFTTDRGTLGVSGELAGMNEVQSIAFATPPTLGEFTLDLGGVVTGNIPFDATAAMIQTALQTATGAGNVAVTGPVGGPFEVTFQGGLGYTDVVDLIPAAGTVAIDVVPTVTTLRNGMSNADVDWYRFEVAYEAIHSVDEQVPRHASLAFDIDYADGFARPNTNLWVFDSQGQLVFIGRDSNVPEDRPGAFGSSLDDLSRGSVGALDPFIGPVEVPARGLAPGEYFVAVSSNAVVPQELDQYLSSVANNTNIRLEPINTVNRIAEDHAGSATYTTANAPQIPILFGADDQVVLSPPPANQLADGESFTITDAAGVARTYEFDANGQVRTGNIPVSYNFGFSSQELGEAIETAILDNVVELPDLTDPDAPVPTADAPLVYSQLFTAVAGDGSVYMLEGVLTQTLLSQITTTDPVTGEEIVQSMVRPLFRTQAPQIRQAPAAGARRAELYVSRPAAVPFNLGDVTLFVSHNIGIDDRSDLVSVDPFTGQLESVIGAYAAHVGDIATTPTGGIFGFSIPQALAQDDATTGHYIQIDPSLTTSAALGTDLGDDGIVTNNEDPANIGTPIAADVGIQFQAITYSNAAVDDAALRGFAIGIRGDTVVDPLTGVTTSTALGISNPANTIFEFNVGTGAAVNGPLGAPAAADQFAGAGASIRDRGALDTSTDAFPVGGGSTTITGVAATTIDSNSITQWFIEDGDYFEIDEDADGLADWTFEFDTGYEFYVDIDPALAVPQILRDGDSFLIDGQVFEFDTGTVLLVNALNGNQLNDGGTLTITNSATNPTTLIFEFDNDNQFTGNVQVPFTATDNRAAIMANLMTAINTAPNFGVQAIQLGNTNRITLIGESTNSPTVVAASGIASSGLPLAQIPGATAIVIEETYTEDLVGQAIMGVIDSTQPGGFQAGAVGNRINFLGVTTSVDMTTGVQSPVFVTINPDDGIATGVPGTIGGQNLAIPFLASDTGVDIGARVEQSIVQRQIGASLTGATVLLDPDIPQPTFMCTSLGTPPLIGQRGTPDCSLRTGGVAPGGLITGAAFIGDQLFAVTDQGALFRVANATGGAFDPDADTNIGDYVDGSAELLAAANVVVTEQVDPQTGALVTTTTTEAIHFAGLSAGPQNAEGGVYANLLFGIDIYGRMFAFDTYGRPQRIFANGGMFVDTGLGLDHATDLANILPTDGSMIQGFSFSNLDDNLWHRTDTTNLRNQDLGHGVAASLDGSRLSEDPALNTSYYFGYEGDVVQPQFGTGVFAPAGSLNTYNFLGGAHGGMVSNPFSLAGYASADKPTLYFNYLLDTENVDADLVNPDLMRDSFRVYGAGEDGEWKLLATNNSDVEPGDGNDEFDPFERRDPESGVISPEQPVRRSETFDNSGLWRQARVDLSPLAGQENLRLRFEFSTAGGLSTGGISTGLDLNTAGNWLRAVGGDQIRDGQMFTLSDWAEHPVTEEREQILSVGFEFDMGPTIVAPTGSAVSEGDVFTVDGVNYEFDIDGNVGVTTSIPHTAVPFLGNETAGELAAKIAAVIIASPPPPETILGNLAAIEPNDTLSTAFNTTLDGTTQIFAANGQVGDNFGLSDRARDVDMVRLFLDAGDTVVAETDTTRLNTQLNTYLRLFDAQGNELAANDNRDPNSQYNLDSLITFTAPTRGVYYVGVSGSHHRDYDPTVSGSGGGFVGAVSSGFYDFRIQVTDPAGPQLSGNRLNLPNNNLVTTTDLPATFVEGAAGVAAGLPHPYAQYDATLTDLPVVPVRVNSGMDALSVADAVRTALADHFAGGNLSVYKGANESVQVVRYGIGDPGPLGLSGPSDDSTALVGSGLFGDVFGAFGASTEADGVTSPDYPGALGMQNNAFEGVYIDDIIIGFAGRGEMVVGSLAGAADLGFTANTNQPAGEIISGLYQLEIRQATAMGQSQATPDTALDLAFDLTRGIDINDRLTAAVTLAVSSGDVFTDGQTFDLSDGSATVTFEMEDLTAANGSNPANVEIEFDPGDSAAEMARRIRDAINSPTVQAMLNVQAISGDGVRTGLASSSAELNLIGDAVLKLGPAGSGTLNRLALEESNDTLATAVETGIVPAGREGFRGRGFIGDNGALAELTADVDLFQVELAAGDFITVDIDANELGSSLDSMVRIFYADGTPVMQTDALGVTLPVESDDDLAPGESAVLDQRPWYNDDSYIAFLAPADGVYYVGVSGFDNNAYDPTVAGSGRQGLTGFYEIEISRPAREVGLAVLQHAGTGDSNLFRDQGQIIIANNQIDHALEFGVRVASSGGIAPRNLAKFNQERLAPGVVVSNNLLTDNLLGGIEFSGDPNGLVVPFGRIVNNTVVAPIPEPDTVTVAGRLAHDNSRNVFTLDATGLALAPLGTTTDVFTDMATSSTGNVYAARTATGTAGTPSELHLLNLATAPAITSRLVGVLTTPAGLTVQAVALEFRADDALFAAGVDSNGRSAVYQVNPRTAVATPVMPLAPQTAVSDIAFDANGSLYLTTTDGSLLAIDPDSAALRVVGALGITDFIGLTFYPDSTMYGYRPDGEVYSINPYTASAVLVGQLSDPTLGPLAGIATELSVVPSPQGIGTGISVLNNASPTLLNNVLSGLETGILVDTTSITTVVGGSLYHNNLTDVAGITLGDFAVVADPDEQLFVDRTNGNFYPAPGSPVIDSSVDSLEERESMAFLGEPLGIAPSPILAPNHDVTGQLRVDDPAVAPPPGLGENVFKDRGAQDRSDFNGPVARIVSPMDNGGNDLDPSESLVSLFRATLNEFSIQLIDRLEPVGGIGVDDSSVNGNSITIVQDNRVLEEGVDYSFTYNATSNTIRLTPLAGVWDQESNYVIRMVGEDRFQVQVTSGDLLVDGMSFDVTDSRGDLVTFEYDSGYTLQVPQSLAIQVPAQGGAVGGVEDGDLITLTIGTFTTTIELDNDDSYDFNNIIVSFTTDTTQGELADALAVALDDASIGLAPVNAGQGLVHLGVDGSQTMTIVSNTLLPLGGIEALEDGDEFTIDDGTKLVTFEFDDNSRIGSGNVGIPFSPSWTHEQVAQKIAESINSASSTRNLGLFTQHVGDGLVHIGGLPRHVVDVLDTVLILNGLPGAERAWGIQIPTVGGVIADTFEDGQTFTIDNGAGGAVTFEFDDNSSWTGGNTRVPFTGTTTPQQLANTLVSRISNYNYLLGLYPQNAGYGYVVLGGDLGYSMNLTNSVLTEVGQPGVAASVAIPFIPDETFTVELAAQATAAAINNAALRDVVATATGATVGFSGAQDADSGDGIVEFVSGISDLAGNELAANQVNGETRFTVFVGAGMDYGDAPLPYPTVRANDGARHEIIQGFSLGATVDVNADGQPSANADGDDLDGDDEDGVVFDSTTPLVPNRTFSLTVSTTGIGTVVDFGVLDAWIDYNRDGDWNDAGEKIISSRILTSADLVNGQLRLTGLKVPSGAVPGDTYARFRLSSESGLGPAGATNAGEVEDHKVTIYANPWQNQALRYDVNNNGHASPIDVLLLINYLNTNGSGTLPLPKPADQPYLDVNGDGIATPQDVLQLVNYINEQNSAINPEGESNDHLEDVLRQDELWLDMVDEVSQTVQAANAHDAVFSELGF